MSTDTLTSRAYVGEADLEGIVEFLNLVEAHDCLEEGSSVTELREEFNESSFDPVSGLRLYENEHGKLVGFAQLYSAETTADNDGFLWFKVHPAHRTGRIEPQMFAWAEERLGERGRVKLRVTARDVEIERQTLIEQHGFLPVRYFLRMRRALA